MEEIEELAALFKTLSDPTRLRLVKLLSDQPRGEGPGACHGHGSLCVNALADRLGVTQPAVSQHLRVLRQAGLVRGVRHGSFVHYSLDAAGLAHCRVLLLDTLGDDLAAK